jgi:hypothetical protein
MIGHRRVGTDPAFPRDFHLGEDVRELARLSGIRFDGGEFARQAYLLAHRREQNHNRIAVGYP